MRALSRAAEFPRLVFLLLIAVLVLCPLPFGSNRPFFEGMAGVLGALGLLGWSLHVVRTGRGQLTRWSPLLYPALCFLPVLAWAGIQTGGQALSVDPYATRVGLLRLCTFLAFFLLAYQAGRSGLLARTLLRALVFSATAYAGYGLLTYASGNAYLLWFPKWGYEESLTGTFVNRNAFAASCGMGLLAALSLLAMAVRRELEGAPPGNRFRHVVDGLPLSGWVAGVGAVVLLISLILSDSRAGFFSAGVGLAVLGAGAALNGFFPRRLMAGVGVAALLVGVVGVGVIGGGLLSRFSADTFGREERVKIWAASVRMIEDAPVTGHGLNTFADLFAKYRTDNIQHSYIRAHSTYLEMAVELGIPVTLLWAGGWLFVGLQLLRGVRTRRQDAFFPILGLAALGQAGVHSLLDFSYQVTANALVLAIILGVGLAQSYPSGNGQAEQHLPLPLRPSVPGRTVAIETGSVTR